MKYEEATLEFKMSKFEEIAQAKVIYAQAEYEKEINHSKKKLDYKTNFWLGTEGLAWFMKKNEISIEELLNEIDIIPQRIQEMILDKEV